MSIFQKYTSEFDREYDILFREHEIEIDHINNNYLIESANEFIATEAEDNGEKKPNKFTSVISAIINSIIKFVSDFVEMIGNILSKKKNITMKDYANSETGKKRFTYDVRKIDEEIEKEILKGRKIIQKISSTTGIPDTEIAAFCDGAANFAKRFGPAVISTGLIFGFAAKKQKKLDNLKSKIKLVNDDAKKVSGDPKKENAVKLVVNAMNKIVTTGCNVFNVFIKEI